MGDTYDDSTSEGRRHDIVSEEKRSEMMSKVGSEDTGPERRAHRLLLGMGYTVDLHDDSLPGSPDLVVRDQRTAVFVHGCFWHMHDDCDKSSLPKTNREFWRTKLENNVDRDKRVIRSLLDENWRVLVIWECELQADMSEAASKAREHFSNDRDVTGHP
jgi:DNA mismatch endonuclease (patch repair protein)